MHGQLSRWKVEECRDRLHFGAEIEGLMHIRQTYAYAIPSRISHRQVLHLHAGIRLVQLPRRRHDADLNPIVGGVCTVDT